MYCIAINFCDEQNNRFVELGGAGWDTQQERDSSWDAIPAVDISDPARCIADKLNEQGDIVGDRCVSRETVESLLGKSILECYQVTLVAIKEMKMCSNDEFCGVCMECLIETQFHGGRRKQIDDPADDPADDPYYEEPDPDHPYYRTPDPDQVKIAYKSE